MQKENLIKEARTIEAMKNGYLGLEGKFCIIAKYLGSPIYQQGSSYFEQSYLQDPYAEIVEEGFIPTLDENEVSYEIGHLFDGLSRGVNMNICVKTDLREIICIYEGEVVYKESGGDLESYAPYEWEDSIEKFYNLSKKIYKQSKIEEREKLVANASIKKKEILEYLKKKWGV